VKVLPPRGERMLLLDSFIVLESDGGASTVTELVVISSSSSGRAPPPRSSFNRCGLCRLYLSVRDCGKKDHRRDDVCEEIETTEFGCCRWCDIGVCLVVKRFSGWTAMVPNTSCTRTVNCTYAFIRFRLLLVFPFILFVRLLTPIVFYVFYILCNSNNNDVHQYPQSITT